MKGTGVSARLSERVSRHEHQVVMDLRDAIIVTEHGEGYIQYIQVGSKRGQDRVQEESGSPEELTRKASLGRS